MIKVKNNKEIRLISGDVYPVNTDFSLTFRPDSSVCVLRATINDEPKELKLRTSSLPRYFSRFKMPGLKTLERWSFDGVAKSMMGKPIEPDGYDEFGSPSWLLVAGVM